MLLSKQGATGSFELLYTDTKQGLHGVLFAQRENFEACSQFIVPGGMKGVAEHGLWLHRGG